MAVMVQSNFALVLIEESEETIRAPTTENTVKNIHPDSDQPKLRHCMWKKII